MNLLQRLNSTRLVKRAPDGLGVSTHPFNAAGHLLSRPVQRVAPPTSRRAFGLSHKKDLSHVPPHLRPLVRGSLAS